MVPAKSHQEPRLLGPERLLGGVERGRSPLVEGLGKQNRQKAWTQGLADAP